MAISYIDKHTLDYAGAQSLTFTIPAGAQTDDLMIAFVKQSENTGQQTWDDDGGSGNGWTREVYNRSTGGRDQETAIYWKVHDGSESNPTFTWNSGGTNEPMSGSLLVYRGTDTANPFTEMSFQWAQNDANPPNPTVAIDYDDSWVVCFHCATHDDITTTAPPTGFTMRAEVWNGTSDDHRNHFVADISNIDASADPYTPPDWQHSVANTTPEYHTYSICLNEAQPIGIYSVPSSMNYGTTGYVIQGFGFKATQSTGKVEIWDDISGTTKTVQTITAWADDEITFTAVQGSLPNDSVVYIVVTNSDSDVTPPGLGESAVGLLPYGNILDTLKSDHLWRFNNSYNDTGETGPAINFVNGVVGTFSFSSTEISENNGYALIFDAPTKRRETADSANMNVTISSKERTVAAWILLTGVNKKIGTIWKEGGGVQNLAFIVGLGNVLMAQLADTATTRDNVQAVASIKLTINRPYHICLRYTHLETTKEMRLFLDGEEQPLELTDGNPMTLGVFDSHSGDNVLGDPDTTLETGGTDIAYNSNNFHIADFCTWSDNSTNTHAGALHKTDDIRDKLFRRGAVPKFTVTTGTQSAMQTWVDNNLEDEDTPDWPLAVRVQNVTGGGDLRLEGSGTTFDDRASVHIEWRGSGELTWVVKNSSGPDSNKLYASGGGTISLLYERSVVFTVKDIDTGTGIVGARIYIEADTGGDLTAGTVLLNDTTNAQAEASFSIEYTNDQPIKGWVRKGSASTYYSTSLITDTITDSDLNKTIFMIKDG